MLHPILRVAAAVALLVAAPLAAAPADDAEQAFAALIAARRAGDVATLKKLTTPDFVQHHAYGLVEPRTIWLSNDFGGPQGAAAGTEFSERAVEMRITGTTAIRSSVVRLRRPARKLDTWVRALVVLTRSADGWQVAEMDSALLYEGPIFEDGAVKLPNGAFDSNESGNFRLSMQGGQSFLLWSDGRSLPLIPLAPDRFVAGHGSTLAIERSASGAVEAVTRRFGERLVWRAVPAR